MVPTSDTVLELPLKTYQSFYINYKPQHNLLLVYVLIKKYH